MALIDLLPDYYKKSIQTVEIQTGLNHSVESAKTAKDELFKQLFVDSATWGLNAWENALGIHTDITKSFKFRRERIKAKIRGAGTTTKAMIQQAATAYSNGEVAVIEDNANFSFKIKFVGTMGIPANMADLTLTIEEIKPAHLSFTFEYIYRTHAELSAYTHEQLSHYTNTQLREEVI